MSKSDLYAPLTLFVVVLMGCAPSPFPVSPTSVPLPAPTPTSEPEPNPTSEPASTASPVSEKEDTSCPELDTLLAVRKYLSEEYEFEAEQQLADGVTTLFVWIVEPDIDPAATTEDGILDGQTAAMLTAGRVANDLANEISCVGQVYDRISPMIVDKAYNAWFAIGIDTELLPVDASSDEMALLDMLFEAGDENVPYVNYTAPSTYDFGPKPDDACTWAELRKSIEWHFGDAPDTENMGFTFYNLDGEISLVGQILRLYEDEHLFQSSFSADTWNIMSEVGCAYPPIDTVMLFVVDRESAKLLYRGFLPGDIEVDFNDPNSIFDIMNQMEIQEYAP